MRRNGKDRGRSRPRFQGNFRSRGSDTDTDMYDADFHHGHRFDGWHRSENNIKKNRKRKQTYFDTSTTTNNGGIQTHKTIKRKGGRGQPQQQHHYFYDYHHNHHEAQHDIRRSDSTRRNSRKPAYHHQSQDFRFSNRMDIDDSDSNPPSPPPPRRKGARFNSSYHQPSSTGCFNNNNNNNYLHNEQYWRACYMNNSINIHPTGHLWDNTPTNNTTPTTISNSRFNPPPLSSYLVHSELYDNYYHQNMLNTNPFNSHLTVIPPGCQTCKTVRWLNHLLWQEVTRGPFEEALAFLRGWAVAAEVLDAQGTAHGTIYDMEGVVDCSII